MAASAAGIGDEDWEPRYEFTGTKLEEFPLPARSPLERARELDGLAQRARCDVPPRRGRSVDDGEAVRSCSACLPNAAEHWARLRGQMIFEQEELDWEVYRLYGLIDEDLTYRGDATSMSLQLGRAGVRDRAGATGRGRRGGDGVVRPARFDADHRVPDAVARRLPRRSWSGGSS